MLLQEVNYSSTFVCILLHQIPTAFFTTLVRNINVNLPDGYKPSATDFQPLHRFCLNLCRQFMLLMDIFTTDSTAHVPACNTKHGGLIKAFASFFPNNGDYITNLLRDWRHPTFDNIADFIERFHSHLSSSYAVYEKARVLNAVFISSQDSTKATPTTASPKYTTSKTTANVSKPYRKPFPAGLSNLAEEGTSFEVNSDADDDDT